MFKSNYITPEDNWFFCLKNIPQESKLAFHNDSFRLGELRLHLMASSGKMFKDGSMNVSIKLKTCTLDDLREGIERATSRFVISQFAAHIKGWCAWHCYQALIAWLQMVRRDLLIIIFGILFLGIISVGLWSYFSLKCFKK